MNSTTLRNDASPAFWKTRYGLVKAIEEQDLVARSLEHYGEWTEREIDLLGSCMQEGHHVLEVGSEYGAHTLWLARAVGPKGQVHVAEPSRLAFQLLCANVAINGLENVYTHACLLGASEGSRVVGDVRSDSVQAGRDGDPVRVRTADSLSLERLDLLKSNVPGGLLDLLAGAAETVRRCRPLIYARLSGVAGAEAEIRAIKELGYRCWSHTPHMHNPRNFNDASGNIFPGCVWQNVVAAPTEGRFELDPQNEL